MKKIGLKKAPPTHLTGTVKEIRHGSEYGPDDEDSEMAHLVISHGKRPRRKGEKKDAYRETRTTRLHIPKATAEQLRIGQKVRVRVEPC